MSTGYPVRHMWVKKQPTSSGQVIEATSGVSIKLKNGSVLSASSGSNIRIADSAALTIQDGGVLNFTSGADFRVNDIQASLLGSSSISARNSGVTIAVANTSMVGNNQVITLAAPVAGVTKRVFLMASSSNIQSIIGHTSAVHFGSTLRFSVKTAASGIEADKSGYTVDLFSTGTATWRVAYMRGPSSFINVSSAIA